MKYSLDLYEKLRESSLLNNTGAPYGKTAFLQQGMLAWLRIMHFENEPHHALSNEPKIDIHHHRPNVTANLIDLLANMFFSNQLVGTHL